MIDKSRIIFDENIRITQGVNLISGSDEVGRGAMAGPIVVASVILPSDYENPKIKDSKLLTKPQREHLFTELKQVALSYAISIIDASEVDKLNPKQASIYGMKESIIKLDLKPDLCLIDAEKVQINNMLTFSIIKGDVQSQVIAAASILAKVTRDKIMMDYNKLYPAYEFNKHKGYCTALHQQKLAQFGITPIHRKTYRPVKKILDLHQIK